LTVNATVLTMDDAGQVIAPGRVLVEGERIARVEEDRGHRPPADEVIDARGGIVIPGLVNAHTHAAMVAFRGVADDLPLKEWLEDYIWPLEREKVTPDLVQRAIRLACAEMALSGTATFVDMYFFQDAAAEVVADFGLRGFLGEGVIDFATPSARDPKTGLRLTRDFVEKWKGHPLIHPIVAPHAPYSCSEELLRECFEMAREYDVPLQIHLAEAEWEREQFLRDKGKTPVRFLADLGGIWERMSGAHMNYVDEEDMRIIRDLGGSVVHNPESNMKLASGICPVPEYLKAGVNVALGTDGAVSNNDLDMFGEMRSAALLHKSARKDPTAVTARQALWMATRGGARLVGMDREIGSIEPGKLADLVLVRTDRPHLRNLVPRASAPPPDSGRSLPEGSPEPHSAIVYSAKSSDVDTVIVAGRVLVRDSALASPFVTAL
jgi:5-methylthioadenosine/S-adenosylhomocysteine deaminase